MLALPDEGRGWVLRAAITARSIINACRPDVVVSSGPPHSAHIAAWLATRGSRARWFIDLRDPWAGPISDVWRSSRRYDSKLSRVTERTMERTTIGAADGVIANSRWLADALARIYVTKPVAWLPNGFDVASIPADRPHPFPGLGIAHLGTLYGNRDLAPAIDALADYVKRNPAAKSDGTKLRVAGAIDETMESRLKRLARDRGLEAQVDFLGVVSREEALRILLRSRLCLVLAQSQMIEVPGKLHESIGAGIPAVFIGPKESAGAAEADRLGASFVEETDPGALVSVYERAAAASLFVSAEQSARVSYAAIAREFLKVVRAGASAT